MLGAVTDVTSLLDAAAAGDPRAAADLFPLVYDELRKLAAVRMASERPGQTLQPTALVHEAYLRLVGGTPKQDWNGRGHFFAAAAEAMRRILVESARRKTTRKRGGGKARIDLDAAAVAVPTDADDLIALNDALDQLAAADPAAAKLVHLRYFAGLTLPEAAAVLDISQRSADRLWAYARAWLLRAMRGA
jgi:RNA polymerase sigma factor (TIGR02999 family)